MAEAYPKVVDNRKGDSKPMAVAKPKAEDINLAGLTIPKLKELATSRGLTIPGKARKADIIEMISKAE